MSKSPCQVKFSVLHSPKSTLKCQKCGYRCIKGKHMRGLYICKVCSKTICIDCLYIRNNFDVCEDHTGDVVGSE